MKRPKTAPLGAHVVENGVLFRAWTTVADEMSVSICRPDADGWVQIPMRSLGDGLHEVVSNEAGPGTLYHFKVNGKDLPDPYARSLPRGVHGPAEVVRSKYRWATSDWNGLGADNVIYELHIGTFTPEGTYRAAIDKLPELTALGITAIELMPLSSAAGRRGWGYDGVARFAPLPTYGSLDLLREFIDACHTFGIGVILDVVYNHFGPAGNYLSAYSPDYFTHEFHTPWGDAPNYENPYMRKLVLDSAVYWLTEFRIDGLRLDAIHEMPDPSEPHILSELAEAVKNIEGPPRMLFAEDDRNEPYAITKYGMDAIWSDDFHHFVHVLLTGESDGYYRCYEPSAEALARTIRRGWFYEGQVWPLTGKPRGAPREPVTTRQLVYFIQNHDQVGNRPHGRRLNQLTALERYCAASMLLLFLPPTPLLFMGQEWAATSPFLYFTDHEPGLGKAIMQGRRKEFAHFAEFASGSADDLPDPQAESTFERSKLDWRERGLDPHREVLRLYRLLIWLRRNDIVLREAPAENLAATASGEVLKVERWLANHRRWMFVNFSDEAVEIPAKLENAPVLAASSSAALIGGQLRPHAAVMFRSV